LRPSEIIALGWDDIDQISWTADVCIFCSIMNTYPALS